jgi:transforming growth factor-beta-induced protein
MSGRRNGMAGGLLALLLPVAVAGCESDRMTMPVEELNLVETAAAAGSFQTLLTAAEAAGLVATLRDGGPFTLFAPTDEAFAQLPSGALETVLADTDLLRSILLYHVVPGRVYASDLTDGQIVTTAEGREFRVTLSGGPKVNGVNIIQTDVEASNGVIHVIDGVLMPVEDNVDTALGAGFNTLLAAVEAAGLESVLRSEGPFTIFAPTDAAFAALGLSADNIGDIPVEALRNILFYHLTPGRLAAADVVQRTRLRMANGGTTRIRVDEEGAFINGSQIVAVDVEAMNGIIHVIDAVLLPG